MNIDPGLGAESIKSLYPNLVISLVSFSSCQRNLIKTFQIEAMIALITKMVYFFMRLVKWPKIDVKKCQNLIFKVDFHHQKSSKSF